MVEIRPAKYIGDSVVTEPVSAEVSDALDRWAEKHYEEVVDILAPHGLHPYDIEAPKWRKIVYDD